MILRRIIAHLRNQEWTAIVIDFVIVVLGVFVATQVADWSAREADKRRGETYVRQMIGDLEYDLAARRNMLSYLEAVSEGAVRANTLLQQPSPNSRDLVVNVYRASEFIAVRSNRATWDEVLSSGDMSLLPSTARRPLADYFRGDRGAVASEALRASDYRRRVRRLISYEVQRAIRAGCGDHRGASGAIDGFVFSADCELNGVTEAQVAASAQALQRDPEVIADLRYQISDLVVSRSDLGRDVEAIESALAALREAAGAAP